MARKPTRQRTSKSPRTKVRGFTLEVGLPPGTTRDQVEKLKALLRGTRGARLDDLFKADVIASTGIRPESPLYWSDVAKPPRTTPTAKPPPKRRR